MNTRWEITGTMPGGKRVRAAIDAESEHEARRIAERKMEQVNSVRQASMVIQPPEVPLPAIPPAVRPLLAPLPSSMSTWTKMKHRAPPRFWAYVTVIWTILMLGSVRHYFNPPAWERSLEESITIAIGLTVMLAILLLAMYFPINIAENRGVSQDALKSIKLLALLGLFFGITWIIALIWACLAPVAVVRNDGPGLYRVHGVDKGTGNDIMDRIRADSSANARIKAELRGIVVSSCVQMAEE